MFAKVCGIRCVLGTHTIMALQWSPEISNLLVQLWETEPRKVMENARKEKEHHGSCQFFSAIVFALRITKELVQ